MAIFRQAILIAALALIASGTAQAQKLPLQLELKSTQTVRSGAPVPIECELTWNGPGILEGRLSLSLRDSGNLLSSAVSSPIVLSGGKNDARMLLPTVDGQSTSDFVELRARFLLKDGEGEVDLGTRPLRVPASGKRIFRIAFCDQFSFKLDPDIAAALQSFSLDRYWRPVGFDPSSMAIPGINKIGRHAPSQQEPSEKLLQSLIGKPDDFATMTDRYEPVDMPVDPHWYCGFNVVIVSQSGFARLRTPQLKALSEWVRAGGSLCVEPLGVLEERHLEFLNTLSASRPAGPYSLGIEGKVELPANLFETLYAGLGHVAVLHKPLDGKQDPGSRPWKELVAFLWKFRKVQQESVRNAGHFRLGDPTLTQLGLTRMARPQLPANYNQMSAQQKGLAQQQLAEQMAQYQFQMAQLAQRQQIMTQQRINFRTGININSVAYAGGVGDLEFNPIQSGDGLLKRLIPEEVEIVPLEYIAGILLLYVLAIGPGEYFLLGLFRLRRFTWITFPLLTIGFTLFTVWLSNDYLSSSVERTHATVIDVGEDGTALRENRFELLYTASTHDVITEIDRGLFTPINHSRFGAVEQNGYGVQLPPGAGYRGQISEGTLTLGPPVIEGRPPGIHHAIQNVPQWTPQINRIFRISPADEEIASTIRGFDWNRNWNLPTESRQISDQAMKVFGPEARVIGFSGSEVLFGSPTEFFKQAYVQDMMGQQHSRDFLTDICVRQPGKLFEVVSQLAPHGGGNFEDLTLLDVTNPAQSLLVIVVPDPDGLRIYRRLYNGQQGGRR